MLQVTASVQILPDLRELCWRAAEEFLRSAQEAADAKGIFNVALSGGSTPGGLYALLADKSHPFRDRLPWQRMHVFWGDERCVPPDNPESNYHMAWQTLLSRVPLSPGNIHRVSGELEDAPLAAKEYERLLCRHFQLKPGQAPRFDLILLGMGSDGHVASLFPGSAALKENKKLVSAVWDPKKRIHRITFTFPVLNNAMNIRFLVAGENKAEAVHKALKGGSGSVDLPVRGIQPVNGSLVWFLDLAAASLLSDTDGLIKKS